MKNLKFHEKLDDLFNQRAVNLGCQPATEFHHPRAAIFNKAGVRRDTEFWDATQLIDSPEDFLDKVVEIFRELESGRSIVIQGGSNLTLSEIGLLNDAYGVMQQVYAKELDGKDHYAVPYGLLTIEGANRVFEENLLIARDFMAAVGFKINSIKDQIHSNSLVNLQKDIENRLPLLMPCAALDMVKTDGEFTRPFLNFDIKFGGCLGWFRLARQAELYLIVNRMADPRLDIYRFIYGENVDEAEELIEELLNIEPTVSKCRDLVDRHTAMEVLRIKRQIKGVYCGED